MLRAGRGRLRAESGGGRGGSSGDGKRWRQRDGREGAGRAGTKRRAAARGLRSSDGRQRGPQPGFSRRGSGCRAAGSRPCGATGACCGSRGRRGRPVPFRAVPWRRLLCAPSPRAAGAALCPALPVPSGLLSAALRPASRAGAAAASFPQKRLMFPRNSGPPSLGSV